MQKPIALQLYTVRDLLKHDFEGIVRKVAQTGYQGVETAGFPESVTPRQAASLFANLDLSITSAHSPLPLGEDKNRILDTMGELGCRRIVCGYLPPDEYDGLDKIKSTCERINEANAVAVANGLSLGLHNHWFEFQPSGGVYPYQSWLEYLDRDVFFELDIYWIHSAGLDPVSIIEQFGERAPLLHVKDGLASHDTAAPMTALGEGTLNLPPMLEAGSAYADWFIVELDRCATDMMIAVEQSYAYLQSIGEESGS